VVFDLENAIKWQHAKDIGIELEETVDEETGEVKLGPGENMLYFDTAILFERFGCYDHSKSQYTSKPTRSTYVIEDVALAMRNLIEQQRNGELPFDLTFIIDSIGCSECYKGAVSNATNNMWFAGALSVSFQTILNDLIPSTLNVTSKYNNTLFYVNKVWNSMTPMGLAVAKEKGGGSFMYATRLSFFLGGQSTGSLKRVSLTYRGVDYFIGNIVKIRVDKNHITDIEHSGEIAFTRKGFCSIKDLDIYKKEYRQYLIEQLRERGEEVSEKDFKEVETIVED
jgi:hypothetical protein